MNADAAKTAHEALIKSGVNFVACLPDSSFQELYVPLSAEPKITYVQVASENDGVGVCMGAWLGGMKPALRRIGLYDVRTYQWSARMSAHFEPLTLEQADGRTYGVPILVMGLSDVRGLVGTPVVST